MRLLDLTGRSFGRLTVVQRTDNKGKSVRWKCICDCGKSIIVYSTNLVRSKTISCGCYDLERKSTHGLRHTKAYIAWNNMRQRCMNPNNPGYKYYGARGITVHPSWDSFEVFLKDMGSPLPNLTLDRRDNRGNYEPSNCRWITWEHQRENMNY